MQSLKKVTIIGGRGYIGRHLAAHLRSSGVEVFIPERNDERIFESDLGDIIYAAGLTGNFRSRPFDTIEAHITLLSQLLKNSEFNSLLYLSSTRVYIHSKLAHETSPIYTVPDEPTDIFNLSKLTGECLALNFSQKKTRVARLSNVVGGSSASDTFIPSIIRDAKSGHITLNSALTSNKDYIHVEDAVSMLALIAASGTKSIYNVASGVSIEHKEWMDAIQSKFGCSVSVSPNAPEIIFPDISISRFCEEFRFRPGSALRAIDEFN